MVPFFGGESRMKSKFPSVLVGVIFKMEVLFILRLQKLVSNIMSCGHHGNGLIGKLLNFTSCFSYKFISLYSFNISVLIFVVV